MKRLFVLMLLAAHAGADAQGLVEVEVKNEALIVAGQPAYPTALRAASRSLAAGPGESASVSVSFDDLLATLSEITWAPTAATRTGTCQVRVRINWLAVAIQGWATSAGNAGIWEPPGSIVGKWQPPGGIAGKWEPPVGIAITPNDVVELEVRSVGGQSDDGGHCDADFVVLAVAEIPPLTDGH